MHKDLLWKNPGEFELFLADIKDPKEQVDSLQKFCEYQVDSVRYTEDCYRYAMRASEILSTIDYPAGNAQNDFIISEYYWIKTDNASSRKYAEKALQAFTVLGNKDGISRCLQVKAVINIYSGHLEEAFRNIFEGLHLIGHLEDDQGVAWLYYTLAILYYETHDLELARLNYAKGLEIFTRLNTPYGCARSLSGLGSVFIAMKNYTVAEEHLEKAIALFRELEHEVGLARVLNDMGLLHSELNDLSGAEEYLGESLKLREDVGHIQGLITTSLELGKVMLRKGDFAGSRRHLEKALEMAQKTSSGVKEMNIQRELYRLFKSMSEPGRALSHLEAYLVLQEKITGDRTAQEVKKLETRLATEKAEKEAEIERLRNVELRSAHDAIAAKNKEILDSIVYARRIQLATLPPEKMFTNCLDDFFLLYKPKDIVAGDFYWLEEAGGRIFIAAADCTGHGVPGAMVSVMCSHALTKAVKEMEIYNPAEILDKTVEVLQERFAKSEEEVKDGMDISLCSIDLKGMEVQFAGAYNPIYVVRKGEISEYRADKQPVGRYDHLRPFTNNRIAMKKGDCVYLLTDGYADQFGGPAGKKFKYGVLKSKLSELSHLPMPEQRNELNRIFEEWKGGHEQVDDVCLIGFRI